MKDFFIGAMLIIISLLIAIPVCILLARYMKFMGDLLF